MKLQVDGIILAPKRNRYFPNSVQMVSLSEVGPTHPVTQERQTRSLVCTAKLARDCPNLVTASRDARIIR